MKGILRLDLLNLLFLYRTLNIIAIRARLVAIQSFTTTTIDKNVQQIFIEIKMDNQCKNIELYILPTIIE